MKDVCSACHNKNWVDNFYVQYDGLIELYNDKYAKPGKALYDPGQAAAALTRHRSHTRSTGPGSSCGTTRAGGRATARR